MHDCRCVELETSHGCEADRWISPSLATPSSPRQTARSGNALQSYSSLEFQLLRWLGKKGQRKMDMASGRAFRDSAIKSGARARPGCTSGVQLAPAPPLSDICRICRKNPICCSVPLGLARQRNMGSSHPYDGCARCSCRWEELPPLTQHAGSTVRVCVPLAWAGKAGGAQGFMPRQWQETIQVRTLPLAPK